MVDYRQVCECGHFGPQHSSVIPGRCLVKRCSCDQLRWSREVLSTSADMVNHPAHYTRGPRVQIGDNPATTGRDTMNWLKNTVEFGRRIFIDIECIDVIRHIGDLRLATAMKYIWRVAFGGKENDREDIEKAIWYLNDWLDNPR